MNLETFCWSIATVWVVAALILYFIFVLKPTWHEKNEQKQKAKEDREAAERIFKLFDAHRTGSGPCINEEYEDFECTDLGATSL